LGDFWIAVAVRGTLDDANNEPGRIYIIQKWLNDILEDEQITVLKRMLSEGGECVAEYKKEYDDSRILKRLGYIATQYVTYINDDPEFYGFVSVTEKGLEFYNKRAFRQGKK
jgi:hypothetical protein